MTSLPSFDVLDPEAWSGLARVPVTGDRHTGPPPTTAWDLSVSSMRPDVVLARLVEADQPVGWEVRMPLPPDQPVNGGGEVFDAVDLRGTRRVLVNRETHGEADARASYLTIPFVHTHGPALSWGLLLDTGGPVLVDVGVSDDSVASFLVLGRLDGLTVLGGTTETMLARYVDITGTPGDWPDWAFGTWMSRASYITEGEIHAVLDA